MITIKLKGGLGNQMFQYALARKLSLLHNTPFNMNIDALLNDECRYYCLDVFNIPKINLTDTQTYFKRKLYKIYRSLGKIDYTEPHFHFDQNVFNIKHATFDGYWQSEKYFMDIREILLKDFAPKILPDQQQIDKIKQHTSVCVHIRRGDYVSNPNANTFHGVLPLDYYHKSIEHITSNIVNAHFFFFSDDIAWVKENFPSKDNHHFIEPAPVGLEYMDMYLMSCCHHHIIANSSFSWWGAWLSQSPNQIVIAPERWFLDKNTNIQDIYCQQWLKF